MKKRRTAREIEREAATAPRVARVAGPPVPPGEAMAMLVRRGLRPRQAALDLPFSPDLADGAAERLSQELAHYSFRLFLRGAIKKVDGFVPEETTQYLNPAQSSALAERLVSLGRAVKSSRRRYRLIRPAKSFGGTLEWDVARELRPRWGFDVAAGLKSRAPGVGGDLDVVAAAEGKLLYLELKSSPPKHLSAGEVRSFFERIRVLRPDVTLFVMDTALRLSDKVLPMLVAELARRGEVGVAPRRVTRELWALTPHLDAVNAKPDLVVNIGRAIAEGLRALSPAPP